MLTSPPPGSLSPRRAQFYVGYGIAGIAYSGQNHTYFVARLSASDATPAPALPSGAAAQSVPGWAVAPGEPFFLPESHLFVSPPAVPLPPGQTTGSLALAYPGMKDHRNLSVSRRRAQDALLLTGATHWTGLQFVQTHFAATGAFRAASAVYAPLWWTDPATGNRIITAMFSSSFAWDSMLNESCAPPPPA